MDDDIEHVTISVPVDMGDEDTADEGDERGFADEPYTVNILENKTCRLKSTDENQANLYLTPIVKHDFINPKIKFSDKNETTVLQNFKLELYDNNKNDLYIIKSLVKFPGIMQPALFYAHHSNTFEIRDVYHRMNGMMGGVSQMRNFLFRCADYKIWLNNNITCDIELTES